MAQIDRIAPTRRPDGSPIGYQTWSNLMFVHWRVSPEALRALIPSKLEIDTFDGDAWVGLVPFHMSKVRPWWLFPVPGVSEFHETNVRTYVHLNGEAPGVCFLSLEAANSLAVRIARWKWRLPYFRSSMQLERQQNWLQYKSRRLWPEPAGVVSEVTAEIGESLGSATPDTLEHFLVERYFLYTKNKSGQLLRGQVHHTPYPLHAAQVIEIKDELVTAAGVSVGDIAHTAFSEGVDVDIHQLKPV